MYLDAKMHCRSFLYYKIDRDIRVCKELINNIVTDFVVQLFYVQGTTVDIVVLLI